MSLFIAIAMTALVVFVLCNTTRPNKEVIVTVQDENHYQAIHDAVNNTVGVYLAKYDTLSTYPQQFIVKYESIEGLMRFSQLAERNSFKTVAQ